MIRILTRGILGAGFADEPASVDDTDDGFNVGLLVSMLVVLAGAAVAYAGLRNWRPLRRL
jgi:hypothetical protein